MDVCGINALYELYKLFKAHLSTLGPTVPIVLGEVLTRRNSKRLKQTKPFRHPYLQKKGKKRKNGEKRERESMSGKKKDKIKNGKDDIWCLDGLKTKRRSMQKLEESC